MYYICGGLKTECGMRTSIKFLWQMMIKLCVCVYNLIYILSHSYFKHVECILCYISYIDCLSLTLSFSYIEYNNGAMYGYVS